MLAGQYDMGKDLNWSQVLGKNKLLWPLPYIGSRWKPNGDGVVYFKKDTDREVSILGEDLVFKKKEEDLQNKKA